MRWGDPQRGVMLDKLTVWREADGSVVFLVPEGRSQLSFSAEEWARAVEFLAEPRCTCSEIGGEPLCPVHDKPDGSRA